MKKRPLLNYILEPKMYCSATLYVVGTVLEVFRSIKSIYMKGEEPCETAVSPTLYAVAATVCIAPLRRASASKLQSTTVV